MLHLLNLVNYTEHAAISCGVTKLKYIFMAMFFFLPGILIIVIFYTPLLKNIQWPQNVIFFFFPILSQNIIFCLFLYF